MQVPSSPASRQEALLQQRQLALRRQRDQLARRSQPQLLGAGAVVAQHPGLAQKKATGWSKFLVDPSLFEVPGPRADPAAVGGGAAAPPGRDGSPSTALSTASPAPQQRRPDTADSTETVACDSELPPVVFGGDASAAATRLAEAPAAHPSQRHAAGADGTPASELSRPSRAEHHPWDLNVQAEQQDLLFQGDASKDPSKGGRGLKFWKPWRGPAQGRTAHISADEPTVVSSFGGAAGGGGDGMDDFVAARSLSTVDSRAVTPWPGGHDGDADEAMPLPGVLEEHVPFNPRQNSSRRPPKQPPRPYRVDSGDDVELLGME